MNGHKGFKLNVKYTHLPVFHYSYVRSPEQMNVKSKFFESFWHDDNYIEQKYETQKVYDYYDIERIKQFDGTHPLLMSETIAQANWDFDPTKLSRKLSLKDKMIYAIEDALKYRFGEYKNYKITE